jgi:nucleoside-diphosphate-sugar epimerase
MPRVFIAGCGFVGLAAARLFQKSGWDVVGGTRSGSVAGADFPVVACDLRDSDTLRAAGACDVVVHCASSSRGGADEYRAVYLDGARNLAAALQPSRLVFTSSTSVYAQCDGSWVTEESPAEPPRETSRLLRETEEFVLGTGGTVARLAGIYGPHRSVLLRRFLSGEAVIEGDGTRYINQIHRDDAASALVRLAEASVGGVFNVADDTPLMQREIYAWLAQHFGRPLPPPGEADPNRKRGITNKRVSNAKLRSFLWLPQFPSFDEAVVADPTLAADNPPSS